MIRFTVLTILFYLAYCVPAFARTQGPDPRTASSRALALLHVANSVRIAKASELQFEPANPGQAGDVILPTDEARALAINVQGNSRQVFLLAFPRQVGLTKQTAQNSRPPIVVKAFTTDSSRQEQVMNDDGLAVSHVGATRDAVAANHPPGDYHASFVITFLYP